MKERQLISEANLFPRCEYYTRFEGTTAFAMDDPDYWATYHRSQSTRYFSEAGGREQIMFSSPCVIKPDNAHSFFSHTGGIVSPFNHSLYKNAIQLTQLTPVNAENLRDKLLLYRRRMAEVVVQSFESAAGKNVQEIKKKGKGKKFLEQRPIVFQDNNFPGALIMLPILNPESSSNEATQYWAEHPKPFQKLLLASFVAILNVKAMKADIPIEMVIRASFGHNLPSICETENTFRINVGIVPQDYAILIGEALHELNQMMEQISDKHSLDTPFDQIFFAKVRKYNAGKLKNIIDNNPRYKTLKDTENYKKATHAEKNFDALYNAKKNLDDLVKSKKGSATFLPVKLNSKKIWQVIREAGDTLGKSLLTECFRKNETVDWFVNAVMDSIISGKKQPIEWALYHLLSCVNYAETATMDYKKIRSDLKRKKRQFNNLSFTPFYETDPEFSELTRMLFEGLLYERPNDRLYEHLERACSDFFTNYKSSETITQEADYGSESEISEEGIAVLSDEDEQFVFTQEYHLSHAKLRLCGGMKAIVAAHYGALIHLRKNGVHQAYNQDIEQMYYEVEGALKMVHDKKNEHLLQNKIRSQLNNAILHFDLTHCNASNAADNKTLANKLQAVNPSVVILDYTSSTQEEMLIALKQCFVQAQVSLVMLVDSGLKNSQAGLDYNPYGELRVCARTKTITHEILEEIKLGLSDQDKLSPQANEMVRICKKRKMAVSVKDNFKPVPEVEAEQGFNEEQEEDYSQEENTISSPVLRKKIKTLHDFGNAQKLIKLNDSLPLNYQCVKTINDHPGSCYALHSSGKIIIGFPDGRLEMWNKSLEKRLLSFKGHASYINKVIILLNGHILSTSDDSTLKEWNEVTGECIRTYQVAAELTINHLASLPNGNLLGSTNDSLLVWDSTTGECIEHREFDSTDITCIAVRPNGNLILGFSDEEIGNPLEEWSTTSWKRIFGYESRNGSIVHSITILPSGNFVSAREDIIKEWGSSGEWVSSFKGHNDWVNSLLVLPGGELLSGSEDNTLKLWELTTGRCLETIKGHQDSIRWIATTPEGCLVSISNDDTLKLWKTTNNLELKLNDADSLAGLLANKEVSSVTTSGFFKPSKIINQYPKSPVRGGELYLQNYLIAYLSKGDLESVKKLERHGASFLHPNQQGIYPLPAAVHNLSIESLRYLESKLSPDEAARQWRKVDLAKAKENIKEIQTTLKESKERNEFGTWYTIYSEYEHNFNNNSHQCLREMTHQKKLFIENCVKWDIDLSGIKNHSSEDIDSMLRIDIYGFMQTFIVHKFVINKICNQLSAFKEEIKTKTKTKTEYCTDLSYSF
ncbi:MAG: WD40 repeat domain-containing protein [Tatlockia sp.]|nr:WD40 repeat domain-containing protein [Tatlockia sp.]